jgi:hypothetical protein
VSIISVECRIELDPFGTSAPRGRFQSGNQSSADSMPSMSSVNDQFVNMRKQSMEPEAVFERH